MLSIECQILKIESRIQTLSARDPVGNAKIIKALRRDKRRLEGLKNG